MKRSAAQELLDVIGLLMAEDARWRLVPLINLMGGIFVAENGARMVVVRLDAEE